MFASAPLYSQPLPSPPTAAPQPAKELQDAFDRQDKLAPMAHRQAITLLDTVESDLLRLRNRLERELVNREISDDSIPAPTSPENAASHCVSPLNRTKLTTKAGLDDWHKAQTEKLSQLRRESGDAYDELIEARPLHRKRLTDIEVVNAGDPRAPSMAAEVIRSVVADENAYYSYQYRIGERALNGFLLAAVYEVDGFGEENAFLPGPTALMGDEAKRKLEGSQQAIGYLNCLSYEKFLARDDAANLRFQNQAAAENEKCTAERERLRDDFAVRFRELRGRLVAEAQDNRKLRIDWRALFVANRLYLGDGPPDPFFDDGSNEDAMLRWGMQAVADSSKRRDVGWGANGITDIVGAGGPGACQIPDSQWVIKYPGLEIQPYRFALVFDETDATRRTKTTVSPGTPGMKKAPGGRFPQNGP